MRILFVMSVLLSHLAMAAEDVAKPEDLLQGWTWRSNSSGVRLFANHQYNPATKEDTAQKIPPEWVRQHIGRTIVTWRMHPDESQRLAEQGQLVPHLRSLMASDDDLLYGIYDVPTKYGETVTYKELEPILTPEQEAFAKTLPDKWFPPLPAGYRRDSYTCVVKTWKALYYSGPIHCIRSSDKERNGLAEKIWWHPRPLSVDEVLLVWMARDPSLTVREEFGHTILWHDENNPTDDRRPQVYWQSGQFLINLEIPRTIYKEVMQTYLALYPPSWDGQVDYDPTRLALNVLNAAIPELERNLNGPLEFMRYSYRVYPFDAALRRCVGVVPDGHSRWSGQNHDKVISDIQHEWAKAPLDQIRIDDYRAAIIANRQRIIDEVKISRDRIRQHGLVHLGPERRLNFGDASVVGP